ncbi:MAG: electron transfer flavoprotein subunit alpha/FixB family protein [Bdellovibrionales bacterium]|nr:electron transfer flavoprotein subunit alpha/FixB family protein [Bdellovibrionales bacterium]
MAKVLVFVEQRDGKLKKASFELLGASAKAGNETHAVIIGDGVAGLANECASYGASKVHVAQDGALKNYTNEAYARALVAAIKTVSPEIVLASHTPMGRDLLPSVAAQVDGALATDCTSLAFSGASLTLKRPVYSGKAMADVEYMGSGIKMATVRPNSIGVPKPEAGKTADATNLTVDLGGLKTKILEVVKGNSARPDVTEAGVVVSGGRSLKSADNFKIIEELADTLGAAVGASRAAVDAGYRPHRDQVGQTGKVVSPSLYIACGISGAIQHLAGMRTSKCIVAINTDPQAPIFQVADYGVVGDLFQVVPALTAECKKLKE